jgi:copper oxidase (laccase) domain-containing protein
LQLFSRALDARGVLHAFESAAVADAPQDLVLPQQVHGVRVVQPERLAGRPADGLWQRPDRPLRIGVRTADCVPVLLHGPDGSTAAIHAGWRGAADRIVERWLAARRRAGAPAEGWAAALGPAADGCCYEVGPEVAGALGLPARHGKIDLRLILAKRLQLLGCEIVERVGPCTICGGPPWASWRRQGPAAGRNVAWIASIKE